MFRLLRLLCFKFSNLIVFVIRNLKVNKSHLDKFCRGSLRIKPFWRTKKIVVVHSTALWTVVLASIVSLIHSELGMKPTCSLSGTFATMPRL